MATLVPVDHDPFAQAGGGQQAYKLVPVDHDPFAAARPRSQDEVADAMIPRPDSPGSAPQQRFGDSLKPVFGGHNPAAEVADLIWPEISPEDQKFRDARGVGERMGGTAAFAAGVPIRMITQGKYGASDALSYFGFPSAAETVGQSERDFGRANEPMLNTLGALGEISAGAFPPGAMPQATFAPTAARSQTLPVPYTARMPSQATAAAQDIAAFERQGVRPFGPAFSQGPLAATAKQLSEVPIIGAPVRNALEESITGLRDRVNATADAISPNATFEQAGSRIQSGLNRFRSAGVDELEPGIVERLGAPVTRAVPYQDRMSKGAMQAAQDAAPLREALGENAAQTTRGVPVPAGRPLSQTLTSRSTASDFDDASIARLVRAPSENTSFAARQEALYERAFRMVPDMRRVNGTDNPDMIAAANTRAAIRGIDANIANDISGSSVPMSGALADRIRDAKAGNFKLNDLRAMRTEIGRALSGGNPLQQTLNRSHLNSLYASLSRDIEVGLETLANRALTRVGKGNTPNVVAAEEARQAVGALRAYRVADRYTRLGMRNIERFIKTVGAESPEAAAKSLVQSAFDGQRGNARKFRAAMSALRPEERNVFSSLVLRELGTPVASARGLAQEIDFSVSSFLTRWRQLSPEAQQMLFSGDHAKSIADIVRIGDRLANVEALANTSRSATNSIGLGSVVTGVGSYGAGGLPALLGSAAGGASLSLLMSRPAYAKWAVKYARLRANVLASPNGVRSHLQSHVRTLQRMAEHDPQLAAVAAGVASDNGIRADAPAQPMGTKAASGLDIKPFWPISDAYAEDAGTPNLPGVPQGVDGTIGPDSRTMDAQISEANKARANNALVRYGDTTVIPGFSDLGNMAWQGLQNAGEAAMAFGPMGEALEAPIAGANALVRSLRMKAPQGLTPEQKRAAEGNRAACGGRRGNEASGARKEASDEAARRANGITKTTPIVDGKTPMYERMDTLEAINNNPFTQAIPGRQGFPSKKEQIELATKYFESGGRMPPPGPWGRDVRASVQEVLSNAYRAQSGARNAKTMGSPANSPGAAEIMAAYRGAKAEADDLRLTLSVSRESAGISRSVSRGLQSRLAAVNEELAKLRQAAKEAEDLNTLPPPEQTRVPRIYRRGEE